MAGTKTKSAPAEEVLHEYPEVSRYRVRVIEKGRADGTPGGRSIDIREYVKAEKFEGFTRRGVRLSSKEDVEQLRDILIDMTTRGWFENPAENDLLSPNRGDDSGESVR